MAVAFEMCSSKHISKYFKDTTTNLVIKLLHKSSFCFTRRYGTKNSFEIYCSGHG